jgi:hypothetical protein
MLSYPKGSYQPVWPLDVQQNNFAQQVSWNIILWHHLEVATNNKLAYDIAVISHDPDFMSLCSVPRYSLLVGNHDDLVSVSLMFADGNLFIESKTEKKCYD